MVEIRAQMADVKAQIQLAVSRLTNELAVSDSGELRIIYTGGMVRRVQVIPRFNAVQVDKPGNEWLGT